MGWIDYKKVYYDMVLQCWMIETIKMVGIADNLVNLFENSKETWRTELIVCDEILGEADIRREIFQGYYFSALLFGIVLIPLLKILKETDLGYATSRDQKFNHLSFIDSLKLYGKSERELDSLVETIRIFSHAVGMVVGMNKCAVLVLKRKKMV